ncbi:hypothetical protein B0H14DRAFT_3126187 [Mycena olivaceomarginata]|nr:hypothetical protein B0H14DRAFT_3126187 [Mycena olivaceomarginata]
MVVRLIRSPNRRTVREVLRLKKPLLYEVKLTHASQERLTWKDIMPVWVCKSPGGQVTTSVIIIGVDGKLTIGTFAGDDRVYS